jgi:membrane protease subunit (stomatin/prohibitin family)
MAPQFSDYGLLLRKFLIENISLPPEVEKAIDTRSSMGAIGNMQTFGQYQAAHAMREAANNPGGMAGVAAGAGAGLGIGHMMGSMMGGFMQPPQQAWGQQPPQQAAPPPAAAAQPSVGDRLKKLKDLHSQGLIDDATFAAKRDAILAEI